MQVSGTRKVRGSRESKVCCGCCCLATLGTQTEARGAQFRCQTQADNTDVAEMCVPALQHARQPVGDLLLLLLLTSGYALGWTSAMLLGLLVR